ncbi:hypothetical protein [Flavobacterium granuli]|uniref:Uncharacterized protein n=1 Tax=Flavobacterium granuli TaxID=280093 RepID=A0A1M5R4F9_9FLAO|nr:hypothetical protein [Flavobacterium granuli]PRZ21596.1 hypothetical protein BC624_10834 [Flavobacterium granuli]SHH20869.1 hypothetical protein SAMN05443373_10933 [Flavobacterium granuli]
MKVKFALLLPLFLLLFGCSNDNDGITPEKETLKSITYEVLLFEYTPDTGNNTSRLRYEIKFTNPNNVAVKGNYKITYDADGLILTPIRKVPNDDPYEKIGANSYYTASYDVESALNPTLGTIKSIKFVSAEFVLADL